MSNFVDSKLKTLEHANCNKDVTFFQAAQEVLESIEEVVASNPKYEELGIVDRMLVPDRVFKFRVTWMDSKEKVHVNTAYRIQFNNAIGPYKGGLRFHPTVNEGVLKFLAFEQIFKNALTGLPIGGGKGGSDFDPKGKSDFDVMRFCQAYMKELHHHIGPNTDVPAGDIGVGAREIGYMFGEYKKLTRKYEGILTGKGINWGGSLARTEATGYGSVYFAEDMLEMLHSDNLSGKTAVVSGSGNVAIFTIEKLYQLGATPITCSDSRGFIHDPEGIDLELLKDIKLNKRQSLSEYAKVKEHAIYTPVAEYPKDSNPLWNVKATLAFPSATQNELNGVDAKNLISNGCILVSEGANMPTTPEAVELFLKNKILFGPAKAANAGGVAVSQLEMGQNASMLAWTFEQVDGKLRDIMKGIAETVITTAREHGDELNLVKGANIAGFKKVANVMMDQGVY